MVREKTKAYRMMKATFWNVAILKSEKIVLMQLFMGMGNRLKGLRFV
jgi:hypothetical protein